MSKMHYLAMLNGDFFNDLESLQNSEIENAIKIALIMVEGFRAILDDLNFDEESLRELQFNLDDNYEIVENIYKKTSNKNTKTLLDRLLTQIAKLDMEIGDLILEHKYAS